MKKIFLPFLLFISVSSFGYTMEDVNNAHYLSEQNIITPQSTITSYRLDDTITRAEVVGIALKLK